MSQKTFNLVSVVVVAVCSVAIAVVDYIGKGPVTAIQDSINILQGAIITICGNFLITKLSKLNKK